MNKELNERYYLLATKVAAGLAHLAESCYVLRRYPRCPYLR